MKKGVQYRIAFGVGFFFVLDLIIAFDIISSNIIFYTEKVFVFVIASIIAILLSFFLGRNYSKEDNYDILFVIILLSLGGILIYLLYNYNLFLDLTIK